MAGKDRARVKLTLQAFKDTTWQALLDLTDWWVLVVSTETDKPLFEVKRGSLFVFENKSLPRMGLSAFKERTIEDRLEWLARGVGVLTVKDEDMFLVRVADA